VFSQSCHCLVSIYYYVHFLLVNDKASLEDNQLSPHSEPFLQLDWFLGTTETMVMAYRKFATFQSSVNPRTISLSSKLISEIIRGLQS
jgi:hypothetical protein